MPRAQVGGVSSRIVHGNRILFLVAKYSDALDDVLAALAEPTRRQVIRRLGHGSANVGELAAPFPITLPSFMKHIRTLESSESIRTTKSGRVRTCTLNHERLALLDDWLAEQRTLARLD